MSTRPLFASASPADTVAASLSSIVFMKVGFHAGEDLDHIIIRKTEEQQKCGCIFWGYGGNSCHPTTQIGPFVAAALASHQRPLLAMKLTDSKFEGKPKFATEFSVDGTEWARLPDGAMVKGSKYALVCRNLRRVNTVLNLCEYEVAIGPSTGKNLGTHLRYRVDKACAAFIGNCLSLPHKAEITYVAEIVEPYAVFLR